MNHCIFCEIVAGNAPAWKILEDDDCFSFLDINPVSPYHTLIITKQHYQDMFDLPESVAMQVMRMIKKIVDLYASKLHLKNLQIVSSSGHEAQQDVFHIHYHIIPRQLGDGQNIRWKTHPEWRSNFDDMLKVLQVTNSP